MNCKLFLSISIILSEERRNLIAFGEITMELFISILAIHQVWLIFVFCTSVFQKMLNFKLLKIISSDIKWNYFKEDVKIPDCDVEKTSLCLFIVEGIEGLLEGWVLPGIINMLHWYFILGFILFPVFKSLHFKRSRF